MKIDKIEYKRVINGAGHLEYDLLQYVEKNRATAAQNLKQSEIDYLLEKTFSIGSFNMLVKVFLAIRSF